mmetsp:Transcript_15405/g.29034  ORF Transcript_15405/g.29034 Transcript_15405/m.29034 type:complete len:1372 (-) Transcript_15405:73-4188(-)
MEILDTHTMNISPAEASTGFAANNHHQSQDDDPPSLCIPISTASSSSSSSTTDTFIEIFPEEISSIPPAQLSEILLEEKAPLALWNTAAMLYMTYKKERESTHLLSTACTELLSKQHLGSKEERTRILAAAGIAYLTQANKAGIGIDSESGIAAALSSTFGGGATAGSLAGLGQEDKTARQREASEYNSELRDLADKHFTRASKLNPLFPMTWIGRALLNLSQERTENAKFFFETTLKHCGMVLPALLGMACVYFKIEDYESSLEMYAKAIQLYPTKAGASARVGLGLACYKLGQIDRAKKAFQRAHEMDPENVEAMVGIAVLEVRNLDEKHSKDYKKTAENAMRLISMANLIDHENAMVQNHLANYYFNKWTPVTGVTVKVEEGSTTIIGSGPITLDVGDRIRIGYVFETTIVGDDDDDDEMMEDVNGGNQITFKVKDVWKGESTDGLKLWKKDYDRVIALAKGAYSSTTVPGIQAESLYTLARVHHIRDEMEKANNCYERAIKLAPDLTPARFGLAQTLIWDETYDEAAGHLRLVVGKSPSATDAHATLGLLEAKSGKDRKAAFSYIKKAIDLEPANADLVLLEALALQQQESDYQQALERYHKALELMESQGNNPSWIILTNMGVLCHETKKYEEAAVCYEKAIKALESDEHNARIPDDGAGSVVIRQKENYLFWDYVHPGVNCSQDLSDSSNQTWNLENPTDIKIGDHVRIGNEFESIVIDITGTTLKVKDGYGPSTDEESQVAPPMILFIKTTNKVLSKFSAISIAFNVARLHEATGKTMAAIELHKAIVKRHPSYVNSYLRLACIARDCGSLVNCSEWLKCACAVAPGNPEVLTLVGNLHLSLCDWKPAQSVFNQLLEQKIPNVEAYSMLCLGNIYFSNLKTPDKYAKHLQYAADFYRRILNKDNANAYAANGIGTVLAEKADLARAKEIFNHVREVSGDSIPDALLNLGHIYLALSKHPEALQMYQSYMERVRSNDAPTSSKSKDDDEAEILLYIAFAYFDWARQTEACNNSKAAPADDRYKHCIEYLEKALKTTRRENLILRYNWCTAKLAAANCVLQKLTRGIRRTAQQVQDALEGLQESLPKVQMMLRWKQEGKKVPVSTSFMNNFIVQCKAHIESAKSHLSEEIRKETEARELRELQKMEILAKQKEKELAELEARRKKAEEQEEIERKARMKMEKVTSLLEGWEQEAAKAKEESEKRKNKKTKVSEAPQAEDENDEAVDPNTSLFDDSSDEEEDDADEKINNRVNEIQRSSVLPEEKVEPTESELFGESDDDDHDDEGKIGGGDGSNNGRNTGVDEEMDEAKVSNSAPSGRDLFGESSSDEESESAPENKRGREETQNADEKGMAPPKKRRLEEDDGSS